MSDAKKEVVKLIEQLRAHPDDPLELEIRVGQFSSDQEFTAGYAQQQMDLIGRLMPRLQKTVDTHPTRWKFEGRYTMVRGEYGNGIRQTCRPGQEEVFQQKSLVSRVDLLTDRPYHLRVSLSRESSVPSPVPRSEPPQSVRLIDRATFLEHVPALSPSSLPEPLIFQWDISKVSSSGKTKKDCTDKPCTYHCEVELRTKLRPLEDKKLEHIQDELIASLLLARGSALLGTFVRSEGSFEPLPPPKLVVIRK